MYKNISILSLMLLLGCASTGQLDSETEPNPINGVFVASITMGGPAEDARFNYQRIGSNDGLPMTAQQRNLIQRVNPRIKTRAKKETKPKLKNDFDVKNIKEGRVLAFEVPAGNYELNSWEIQLFSISVVDENIRPKNIQPLYFSVKPGEITYIGNLHLETTTSKGLFGRPYASGGYANITDTNEIDLPIFREKYPKLKDLPVNINVPVTLEWGLR